MFLPTTVLQCATHYLMQRDIYCMYSIASPFIRRPNLPPHISCSSYYRQQHKIGAGWPFLSAGGFEG
jgi:hypothetical protein